MTEKYQPIPHRLKNMAVGGHVAGAEDIDAGDGKTQQDINADTYRKSETYNREQIEYMAATHDENFVNLEAESGDTLADIFVGVEGAPQTLYRVGNWDGEQYDTTKYSQYSFDGTNFVLLSVWNNGLDENPTEDSDNLVKSGGVYGSTMIVAASPSDDSDVVSYVIDKDSNCIAQINKDGSIKKFALTEDEALTLDVAKRATSESPYNDPDVIKYITDDNLTCIGYIKKDGTVVIRKAKIEELEGGGGGEGDSASESKMAAVISMLGVGVDNIEMSNNPKMMSVLNNLFTEARVELNKTNSNNKNLSPCISLIDDDTIDNQIPDSHGASEPTSNTGGYFSVLLPLTLSLSVKHNKPVPVGLACEGHRVGLTSYHATNDNYSALNTNGNAVKWIHNNMKWNVLSHSMTAQLPEDHTYYVDGIDSELADIILARGSYSSYLSFQNTCVIDRLTGKWYEVNSTKTAWVERTPTKKYAMPFYREYINPETADANHEGPRYFNRDFDFEYSWGEWFKRAEELGLPFERGIVHNGSTSSVYMAYGSRKYAYYSVRTTGTHNLPPIPATVNRTSSAPTSSELGGASYNVWHDKWVANKEKILDECVDGKTWVVFMSHFNDQRYHRNYYLDGYDYPSAETGQPELRAKDPNYPSEWIIPLKNEEILDIIGENVHDYINHPPSRLNISTWDEWHPAPGTQLAAIYYIWDKALDMGIDIVTPMDAWATHGNVLNIGIDRNGQSYQYDDAEAQTPYTDEEKSYLTIGADSSIRYYNSKQ